MGFLGSFSDRFFIAVGIWPFASFALTLPILAFLYHRDGRIRFWSAAGAYASVLYGLGLVFFTLWPLPSGDSGLGITYGVPPQLNPFAFIGDIREDGAAAVFQIVANIVFFVPLGFIFRRGLRWGFPLSLVLSFVASLLIETAQLTGLFGLYPYSYRTFDVDDLVWNTSGAVIGWLTAQLLGRLLPERSEDAERVNVRPGFVQRSVAFLLDMTIVGFVSWCLTVVCALAAWLFGVSGEHAEQVVEFINSSVFVAGFIVVEGVWPWLHRGQTPGGAFVRMTIEGRERAGARRVIFYIVRLAVLGACIMVWPVSVSAVAVPVVLIYYLVKRQMPYDAI